jgi:hypothetical protein
LRCGDAWDQKLKGRYRAMLEQRELYQHAWVILWIRFADHHDKTIKGKNFHFPLGLKFEHLNMKPFSLQIKDFTTTFPYFEFLVWRNLCEVTDLSFGPLGSLILT